MMTIIMMAFYDEKKRAIFVNKASILRNSCELAYRVRSARANGASHHHHHHYLKATSIQWFHMSNLMVKYHTCFACLHTICLNVNNDINAFKGTCN